MIINSSSFYENKDDIKIKEYEIGKAIVDNSVNSKYKLISLEKKLIDTWN